MSVSRSAPPRRRARLACALGALLLAACGAEPQRTVVRPSIVYVSLDTTRADRLGLYGAERPTSPQLDALAEHALVFDAMRAPSGNTLLSHASLFTGLFPRAHGARPAGKVAALPDAARTLAEDFAEAGYDCAAFTTHAEWLSPAFGMHQGFDHFDASRDAAPQVLQRVRAWLDARESERPFFLFVHLFDVHSDQHGRPYAAPESTAGRFTQPPGEVARDWEVEPVGGSLFLRGVHRGYLELRPGEVDELLAQYDEGLLALDAEIGAFLTEVRNERAPRAWISVSADHGEEFFEHGSPLHYSLYEEILRIPWLLVPPARAAPAWATPRRLAAPVSLLDVRRTLVALAGLPRASADHGRDLLPWLRGERGPPKPTPFPLLTAGLIMENWKLVRPPGGAWELYDLAHDPHELNDLAATERGREPLANLLAELQRLDEEHVVIANALHSQEVRASPELDAEAQQHLEALGYTR